MSSNNNQNKNKSLPTSTQTNKDSLDSLMNELSYKYNQQASKIMDTATQVQITRDQAKGSQTKSFGSIVLVDKDIANAASNCIQTSLAAGAKEFEAKAGRPMTYSEMRAMWG